MIERDDLDTRTIDALRISIVIVATFDLVVLTAMIVGGASSHRRWAGGLGALADRPAAIVAAAIVGLAGVVLFARRPTKAWGPILAIAATAILHDVVGRVLGVFHETFYHAGAALFGWAAGVGWARAVAADEPSTRRLAARCAVAAFAATYVCAGMSKLHDSGIGWADADGLRLVVLSHLPMGAHGAADAFKMWMVAHPRVAQTFGVAALVVELGAWTMLLGARWRRATGALLLGFHVGTFLLMRVFFLEAAILLGALVVPWSRGSKPPSIDEPPSHETSPRRVARAAVAIVVALATFALVARALPSLPRAHPIEARDAPGAAPSPSTSAIASSSAAPIAFVIPPGREPQLLALVTPLRLGDEVADGFVLDDLSIAATSFTYRLRRKDEVSTVEVSLRGDASSIAFTLVSSPDDDSAAGRVAHRLAGILVPTLTSGVLERIVVRVGGS